MGDLIDLKSTILQAAADILGVTRDDLEETRRRKGTGRASNPLDCGLRNTPTEDNADVRPTSGKQNAGLRLRALQYHGNYPSPTSRAIPPPGCRGVGGLGGDFPPAFGASICYEGVDSAFRGGAKPAPTFGLSEPFLSQFEETPEPPLSPSTSKAFVPHLQFTKQPSNTGFWSSASDFPSAQDVAGLPTPSNACGDYSLATEAPLDLSTCGLDSQFPGDGAFQLAIPQNLGPTSHMGLSPGSRPLNSVLQLDFVNPAQTTLFGSTATPASFSEAQSHSDWSSLLRDPSATNKSATLTSFSDDRVTKPSASQSRLSSDRIFQLEPLSRKRKRRRYEEAERNETHMTRKLGGCMQCRSRRKRVSHHNPPPLPSFTTLFSIQLDM